MNNIYDMIDTIDDTMRQLVNEMDYVPADDLGLDRRAAYRVWVNSDCIIVSKSEDRTLQYYGGFEYVDRDYRYEMGDYVVYLMDDDRVKKHILYFYQVEDEYEEQEDAA